MRHYPASIPDSSIWRSQLSAPSEPFGTAAATRIGSGNSLACHWIAGHHHTPKFAIDESGLALGVRAMTAMALEYLGTHKTSTQTAAAP